MPLEYDDFTSMQFVDILVNNVNPRDENFVDNSFENYSYNTSLVEPINYGIAVYEHLKIYFPDMTEEEFVEIEQTSEEVYNSLDEVIDEEFDRERISKLDTLNYTALTYKTFNESIEEESLTLYGTTLMMIDLSDAYEVDFVELIKAVKLLMYEYDTKLSRSLDYFVNAYNDGIEDFVDNVNEYANVFSTRGYKLVEFYDLMLNTKQQGNYDSDDILDDLNYFVKKIIRGFNYDDFSADMEYIGLTKEEVFKIYEEGGEPALALNIAERIYNIKDNEIKQSISRSIFGSSTKVDDYDITKVIIDSIK